MYFGKVVLVFGLLTLWGSGVFSAPQYDEDKLREVMDREARLDTPLMWRELEAKFLDYLHNAVNSYTPTTWHQKRNSEIINSLLGLPKTMTDAGRK